VVALEGGRRDATPLLIWPGDSRLVVGYPGGLPARRGHDR
jgi:hypothetical protein